MIFSFFSSNKNELNAQRPSNCWVRLWDRCAFSSDIKRRDSKTNMAIIWREKKNACLVVNTCWKFICPGYEISSNRNNRRLAVRLNTAPTKRPKTTTTTKLAVKCCYTISITAFFCSFFEKKKKIKRERHSRAAAAAFPFTFNTPFRFYARVTVKLFFSFSSDRSLFSKSCE